MKIHVASPSDTLRTIADAYGMQLDALIFMNPRIPGPDVHITGAHVELPPVPSSKQAAASIPFNVIDEPYADNWIPVTPLESMAETDYDVLIVGSGAAGGAALWRLSEQWGDNGKKIGVIESGGALLPTHLFNIPTLNVDLVRNLWRNPKYLKQVRDNYPSSGFPSVPVHYYIADVLGGKTLHWGAACPRMHPVDLAGWPLSLTEMNHYYNIAERLMFVTSFDASGSAIQETMLERLHQNGFPDATPIPRAADLRQSQLGQIHSSYYFSSIIFLAMAMNRRPVDLAIRSRAVRVIMEKGRIAGIEVKSPDLKSYVIKAKTVILAASTLEIPRLLLYSGVPGDAIGHYLANHSRLDAAGTVPRSDFAENLGMLSLLLPRTETRPYQMQISYLNYVQYKPSPLLKEVPITLIPSGFVESRFANRISLDPVKTDKFGVPELRVHFSYSDNDYEVINQMAEGIRHAASAMKVSLVEQKGGHEITLRPAGGENHDMGTCRMGKDAGTSATNTYGQIHGVSGLYAAGNCVIPTTGAANPTLTGVALAIRTADYIAEQMK